MKKVLIFVLLVSVFGGAILFWQRKNTNDTVDEVREGTSFYLDSNLVINNMNTAYYGYILYSGQNTMSIENLISKYNEAVRNSDIDAIATLNSDGTITITNEEHDYSFDCSIVKNNCKYKIVCLEEETDEFDSGEC